MIKYKYINEDGVVMYFRLLYYSLYSIHNVSIVKKLKC